MNSRHPGKYSIGCILVDLLLLIDMIVDICTGKLTWEDLLLTVLLVSVISIPVIILIKKYAAKRNGKTEYTPIEAQHPICQEQSQEEE